MKQVLLIFSFLLLFSCDAKYKKQIKDFNFKKYILEIEEERLKTDVDFMTDSLSPLPKEELAEFEKLEYFEIDTNYRVKAKVERVKNADTILFKTTTDRTPKYYKYGIASFKINGKDFKLNLYRNVDFMNHPEYGNLLFLPFGDHTNGFQTYGGGRYIDIKIPEGEEIIIDFNKSYNPYCAYNKKYSCPIPPDENYLEIEILSGVKNYNH